MYKRQGQPWDLDRSDGGVHILPPYMREGDQGTWYKGTANAIYQNIGFLDLYDPLLVYFAIVFYTSLPLALTANLINRFLHPFLSSIRECLQDANQIAKQCHCTATQDGDRQ